MSLIKCPSCQKQISDRVKTCPHCEYSFKQSVKELNRAKVLRYRKYRDRMYRYKMFTFSAIAIAVFGFVPMLWTYAQAIDYGFNASIMNHWGIYLVMIGFLLYVSIRVMMYITKRNYKSWK